MSVCMHMCMYIYVSQRDFRLMSFTAGRCGTPLIKVHKKNFPGRPVVSQVDDPTYNMCKELTRILNPLDESGRSFIKDSFALKDMLKNITITDDCRLFSLDIKSLYPKVPLWKALQCTRQALQADETRSK